MPTEANIGSTALIGASMHGPLEVVQASSPSQPISMPR